MLTNWKQLATSWRVCLVYGVLQMIEFVTIQTITTKTISTIQTIQAIALIQSLVALGIAVFVQKKFGK
jgi:hypothetical protein